ncbi:MAG: caspase family protein [Myxococcota bacterium]
MIAASASARPCPKVVDASLEGEPGSRKLALLVGVGNYAATLDDRSVDLDAPPADVAAVQALLVDGYGFPAGNVCTLIDDEATLDAHAAAWSQHLGRAAPGDTVVYFFAGHGTQVDDGDGPTDEADGFDEGLVFHDSFTDGRTELVDDALDAMIAEVYAKTSNITVILDACHSATASRAEGQGRTLFRPAGYPVSPTDPVAPMPEVIRIGAARDDEIAIERDGQGLFTGALVGALTARGGGSWARVVGDVVARLEASGTSQTPSFEGPLAKQVFGDGYALGADARTWRVTRVKGDTVTLRGAFQLGWAVGAQLVVRDEGGPPKAVVELTKVEPGAAWGRILDGTKVRSGDLATLRAPATGAHRMPVALAAELPHRDALLATIENDPVLSATLEVEEGRTPRFRVGFAEGAATVTGLDGRVRNRYAAARPEDARKLAYALGLHARQALVYRLASQRGDVYAETDMLEMRIVPHATMAHAACPVADYAPSVGNPGLAEVPLCLGVSLEVRLVRDPYAPLHLGVLKLAQDGSIDVLTGAGRGEVLATEGDVVTIPLGVVSPPVGVPEGFVAIASHDRVDWGPLAAEALPSLKGAPRDFGSAVHSDVAGRGLARLGGAAVHRYEFTTASLKLVPVFPGGQSADADFCRSRAGGSACP